MTKDEYNALVNAWHLAEANRKQAVENELDLRTKLAAASFQNPDEGTNYADLGSGWRLKMVHRLNYKLDKDTDKIEAVLEGFCRLGNDGPDVADALVSWKPELSGSAYRKVDAKYQTALASILTITPGTPALELVAPKAGK